MNAVNPLIMKMESAQATTTNRNATASDAAFLEMLLAGIDGRAMSADRGKGHAAPAKPTTPMPGTADSPSEDDQASLPNPGDSPNAAPVDASPWVAAALLGMAGPQSGQAALKPDTPNANAGGIPPDDSLGTAPNRRHAQAAAAQGAASLPDGVETDPAPEKTSASVGGMPAPTQSAPLDGYFGPVTSTLPTLVAPVDQPDSGNGEDPMPKARALASDPAASRGFPPIDALPSDRQGDAASEFAGAKTLPDPIITTPSGHADVLAEGAVLLPGDAAGLAKPTEPVTEAVLNTVSLPLPAHLPRVNDHLHTSDSLPPRVGTPDWRQSLGQKIVWMVEGAQQTATLTLNPPDLGPMRIVLNFSDNQVGVTFISAQPEVRAAIQAAMPRLHEMMDSAGLQMGGGNVGSGASNPDAGGGQATRQDWRDGRQAPSQIEPVAGVSTTVVSTAGLGMIDTHA
ncbi:MAG: flagellar hook-length control protein FliK [Candidatus Methylumidiphilus sp.]